MSPALLLWVTVSKTGAYIWTWVGPDPKAAEVRQALQIVVGATESQNPVGASATAFVKALDRISLARDYLLKGTSPQQLQLALFMDGEGKVSGEERPVLSGRFSVMTLPAHAAGQEQVLPLLTRLDADQDQGLIVEVGMKGEVEAAKVVATVGQSVARRSPWGPSERGRAYVLPRVLPRVVLSPPSICVIVVKIGEGAA